MRLLHLATLTCFASVSLAASAHTGYSADMALKRANALTGLARLAGAPVARAVRVAEDVTPYLGKDNLGKRAWRIEYPAGPPYRLKFVVVLDARSGHLLYVSAKAAGRKRGADAMPSYRESTRILLGQEEVYEGYPVQDPKVDFLSALENIVSGGFGNPLLASEIHGAYVLDSQRGLASRAVWTITLRGLPPIAGQGPDPKSVPREQRNHMRNLVSADTGKVLQGGNSP
jgi:hypothetical protein